MRPFAFRRSGRSSVPAFEVGWGLCAFWMACLMAGVVEVFAAAVPPGSEAPEEGKEVVMSEAASRAIEALVQRHGESQRSVIERGVHQVLTFWRQEDGGADVLEAFVVRNYAGSPAVRDALFERFEFALEQLDGHLLEISRAFRRQSDLDLGPLLPLDEMMAGYDPGAHVSDDFFANKIAFVALLNFPLTTLEVRLEEGPAWDRRTWAEVRLAQRFSRRVPAEVAQAAGRAEAATEQYIAGYNIWMHHLVDQEGRRLFRPGLRLISHWNLRDELKAAYSDPDGLERQRMIQVVMDRIVRQTIPRVVIDNPFVDWNPYTNEVWASDVRDHDRAEPDSLAISGEREPDTRYAMILERFHAARLEDPYSPLNPTLLDRKFNEEREIPETRVVELLEAVLTSPQAVEVARLIRDRLGRPLEPFDVWYSGFRPRGTHTEEALDRLVKARYPGREAFQADLPNLLVAIGFSSDQAAYLAENIVVDPSRGAGHAMGAAWRGDRVHLRTRIGPDGMNYKGFNVAVHELGHNVEQVYSLKKVDHVLLSGVPNSACTEAIAFLFQARDLELLGLARPDMRARAFEVLDDFWQTYEIAGVAMVDIGVWRWMYAHPDATPGELREATIGIAKEVWNRYYAPAFHIEDVALLAIYSHIVDAMLYTPDYPIGHLIAFQLREHIEKSGHVGEEVERIARIGRLTPDLWMIEATGQPISAQPLLEATSRAVAELR